MFPMLLENSITAAVLALVVFALCGLLRLNPAARHALWLIVVVKLLSPVGLLWEMPLPFERPTLWEPTTPSSVNARTKSSIVSVSEVDEERAIHATMIDESADQLMVEAAISSDLLAPTEVIASDLDRASPTVAEALSSETPLSPLSFWLPIVWLAGALAVAGRFLRRTLRFARFARSGKEASPSLQRQVAEMAGVLRVRAPMVRVLADLPSPAVWCFWRPVLLWPKGLQDELSPGGRRAVLVHELAHLRRRDHWVRWLELAAAVIHWWNPVFWLVRRQMRFHAELACDAWVTETLPETRRDYAEALLEVCLRSNRAAAPSPAVGVGGDGRRDFQRRLTMIMRDQAPCRLAAGAKLFVVLLLTAVLPAWTLGQGESKSVAKPAANDTHFEIVQVQVGDDRSDAAKKLEAKIAELTKQLEALKAAKAAAATREKAQGSQKGEGDKLRHAQLRIITMTQDGKVIETRDVDTTGPIVSDGKGAGVGIGDKRIQLGVKIEADGKNPMYKVIGPDGKEIHAANVRIVFDDDKNTRTIPKQVEAKSEVRKVEVFSAGSDLKFNVVDGKVINLTRATYTLPKEKAASLAAFLKENVKASVLEIKIEEKGLTVTTTPETQTAISGIAKLISGSTGKQIHFRILSPDAKDAPATPTK